MIYVAKLAILPCFIIERSSITVAIKFIYVYAGNSLMYCEENYVTEHFFTILLSKNTKKYSDLCEKIRTLVYSYYGTLFH